MRGVRFMTSFPPLTGATLSVAATWPAPSPRAAIVPVFLPHFGCPRRCLFCAQETQTGVAANARLPHLLTRAHAQLEARAQRGQPPAELAFYGGTFTALPQKALGACLDFAASVRRAGLITSFRCSTRPDAVNERILARLASGGCTTVELGVQSFSDEALEATYRGYTGERAKRACAQVSAAGLTLGVQLLPGMPKVTPTVFLDDVRAALAAGATALRFYPCLVLEDTGLAERWEARSYQPWSMEWTLDTLAVAWLIARRGGAHVLRMGVAPGKELEPALRDGPWHPALGSRVLGRAMMREVEALFGGLHTLWHVRAPKGCAPPAFHLEVPAEARGFFWGHAGELRDAWDRLGLGPRNVRFVRKPGLRLWIEGKDDVYKG